MMEWWGLSSSVDRTEFATLGSFLALDLAVAGLLVRGFFLPRGGGRDFAFTCIVFNLITFCLCGILGKVPMEIGFALGLFGVFGILRYRTEPIRSRDLTYLFVMIGLAMMEGLASPHVPLAQVALVNGVLVLAVGLLDHPEVSPPQLGLLYDRLDLLVPARREELLRDLCERIGSPVRAVQVQRVDLLRDSAELSIVLGPEMAGVVAPSLRSVHDSGDD